MPKAITKGSRKISKKNYKKTSKKTSKKSSKKSSKKGSKKTKTSKKSHKSLSTSSEDMRDILDMPDNNFQGMPQQQFQGMPQHQFQGMPQAISPSQVDPMMINNSAPYNQNITPELLGMNQNNLMSSQDMISGLRNFASTPNNRVENYMSGLNSQNLAGLNNFSQSLTPTNMNVAQQLGTPLGEPMPQMGTPVPQMGTPVPQMGTPVQQMGTPVPQMGTPMGAPNLSGLMNFA